MIPPFKNVKNLTWHTSCINNRQKNLPTKRFKTKQNLKHDKGGDQLRIVACYKCVLNDQEISVKADGTLDTAKAQLTISRYDLEAVETAVRFKGDGDEVCALTVAGAAADNSKLRKAILSRGPESIYAVHDALSDEADSLKTAEILKAAIEKMGDVELVLCGEGSEDMYCRQVGPMLGALLGWTNINAVSKISRCDDGILVERNLENSTEVLKVPFPAVISVCAGTITPRVPSMKEILAAGKKPFTRWEADELTQAENSTETLSVLAPKMTERRCEVIKGEDEESVEAFYQLLRKAL